MRQQQGDGNTARKGRRHRNDRCEEFHTENAEDTRSAAEEEIVAPRQARAVLSVALGTFLCIANLANHRSPRLFSDALPVTRCFA